MAIDTSGLSSIGSASGGNGILLAKKGITTIGDALAATNGYTKKASIETALQTRTGNQVTGALGPPAQPQVTDFVSAKLDKFATEDKIARDASKDVVTRGPAPAPQAPPVRATEEPQPVRRADEIRAPAAPLSTDAVVPEVRQEARAPSAEAIPEAPIPETTSGSQAAGVYSAVAAASTSTIRGAGVDVVA